VSGWQEGIGISRESLMLKRQDGILHFEFDLKNVHGTSYIAFDFCSLTDEIGDPASDVMAIGAIKQMMQEL